MLLDPNGFQLLLPFAVLPSSCACACSGAAEDDAAAEVGAAPYPYAGGCWVYPLVVDGAPLIVAVMLRFYEEARRANAGQWAIALTVAKREFAAERAIEYSGWPSQREVIGVSDVLALYLGLLKAI